mmetsp:Transcript_20721/g.49783  ORF Transcript_20721/g.49783 Transcript_20721/m.49783 type:complete len:82 (-) Transcript_20721:242-487(-)
MGYRGKYTHCHPFYISLYLSFSECGNTSCVCLSKTLPAFLNIKRLFFNTSSVGHVIFIVSSSSTSHVIFLIAPPPLLPAIR